MKVILGLSAYYHDAAAALVVDGRIVAAAQEERFTRLRHDASFPSHAIAACLQLAGLDRRDIDFVAYYEKPLRKMERLIENYVAVVPRGYRSFRKAAALWTGQRANLDRDLRRHLPEYSKRVIYTAHHEAHAASAFFPSPFEEAAILTMDGVGEWSTATIGHGAHNRIKILEEIRYPHSLGLLYSAFTYYCGFRVNSGEYKLMGLAPYGQPVFREMILERLIDLKNDGSLRMDMSYFDYCHGLTMTSKKFHRLFGGPPRQAESTITQRDKDLAASIQSVTEEVMLRMARHAQRTTKATRLVMAGGAALNCVGNGRIWREGPFDELWIQPAAGDAGGALGAAIFVWHQLLDRPRPAAACDHQHESRLGPAFTDAQIRTELDACGAIYHHCQDDHELCDRVAHMIDQQAVVGWFQGRMEFGPRALGGRSILGDARSVNMQSIMNLKIKFRESFRPFAPCVLHEQASELFEWKDQQESPYMMLVARARESTQLPAVIHVDGSARVQTVRQQREPLLYQLLERFKQLTGYGALINTSFNVRSEPMVCTPAQAFECFMMTDMDALAIGRLILRKSDQTNPGTQSDREKYTRQFAPD